MSAEKPRKADENYTWIIPFAFGLLFLAASDFLDKRERHLHGAVGASSEFSSCVTGPLVHIHEDRPRRPPSGRKRYFVTLPWASHMVRHTMVWVQVALGVIAAVALVVYSTFAAGNVAEPSPFFWLFVVFFLLFIGWDILLHVRGSRSQRSP